MEVVKKKELCGLGRSMYNTFNSRNLDADISVNTQLLGLRKVAK